jgi:hypothetical protein
MSVKIREILGLYIEQAVHVSWYIDRTQAHKLALRCIYNFLGLCRHIILALDLMQSFPLAHYFYAVVRSHIYTSMED